MTQEEDEQPPHAEALVTKTRQRVEGVHDPPPHRGRSRGARITLQAFIGMAWLLGIVAMLGVAGTAGATDYTIDDALADLAIPGGTLNQPSDVAVDRTGAVYIADTGNDRVLKAAADGTITTFAGTGGYGVSGDGGPATAAQLNYPTSVAVADDGTVYIADTLNHRVRKVVSDGTITTFAGTGGVGISGDGGLATAAELGLPQGVAVADDGTVYIADTLNHRVRKVASDGIITTLAGMGNNGNGEGFNGDGGPATAAQLNWPYGLAVDRTGAMYIADEVNYRVRKVAPDGTITTFAGTGVAGGSGDGGPATAAQLNRPYDVAVDSAGAVYIADKDDYRVRKVAPDGIITTVAGRGTLRQQRGRRASDRSGSQRAHRRSGGQ